MREDNIKPKVHKFNAIKFNKNNTQFQLCLGQFGSNFITDVVRLEQFQGFSKGYNFDHYFRLRNKSNWSKCNLVTGLWKTIKKDCFYGNYKEYEVKTLLIFKIGLDNRSLIVYEFPKGYYPNRDIVDLWINELSLN